MWTWYDATSGNFHAEVIAICIIFHAVRDLVITVITQKIL